MKKNYSGRYNSKCTNKNRKNAKKKKIIANKLRFSLFCIVCIICTVSLFGMFTSANASKYQDTYVLTVATGDTLWDIAKENNPLGKDVRRVVDDIIRLNKLTSSQLSTGDKLIIPVY